jgi:nucleoside-diphosphate-sugar epimerase
VKIFVTGASGFVGGAAVSRLSDEKARESMGYRPVITVEEGLQALSGAA